MFETMKHADGVGLAAPQVGDSRRILVVDGNDIADVYPYLKGFRRAMINPEVLEESDAPTTARAVSVCPTSTATWFVPRR